MIEITRATIDHIEAIRSVQRTTWLATYPNVALGITQADIAAKFASDDSDAGRPSWLAERLRQFENERFGAWVAHSDGVVVGYCIAEKEQTQNRIKALYVLPTQQKKGIGKGLAQAAFAWFGKGKDAYVNVASYNENAIAFYEVLGFVKTDAPVSDEVAELPSSKTIPEIEMVHRA
jgi:ribosomal-protein-alanine N-acetyltransferase